MSAKGCVTRNDCGRHGRHGSCGGHGSCSDDLPFTRFFQVLLALLLILLFVVLIVYLALRPHKPRFYLQDATVRELNLSDGFLTSSLQFTVVSHNPNNRVGVLYGSLSTYASYLGEQITAQCPLPPFYQDDNDVNFLNPILYGNEVPLATVVCQHLNYERQNGLVSLSLRMEGRIRWKVGSWTSGHYHLNVNCWAILGMSNYEIGGQVPLQPGTKCRVEVITCDSYAMGRASSVSHLPSMRPCVVSTWEGVKHRRCWYINIRIQHMSIYAPPTIDYNTGFGPSALMVATVNAGGLRGRGIRISKGRSKDIAMLIQVWVEVSLMLWSWKFGLNSQATSAPPTSWTAPGLRLFVGLISVSLIPPQSAAYHPPPAIHFLCRSSPILALHSPATMVRQRMLSRRGSSRGGSSRPSAAENTSPYCHCHYHCPFTALRPGQFLLAHPSGTSSSPSFGSAVFTFNASLNCPRINAHVSVLFIEEAQEEGEASAQRENSPPTEPRRAMEMPFAIPVKDLGAPVSQRADAGKEPDMEDVEKVPKQEVEEYGWCRIVEEVSED